MKLVIALLVGFLSISQGAWSQFKTTTKNGKQGVSLNGNIILKPKFEQVLADDDSVITAFKKDKIYYYNLKKELVYKGPREKSESFHGGTGVVFHPKNGYYLLDRSGKNLLGYEPIFTKPERIGSFVLVIGGESPLFCGSKLLDTHVDSVQSLGQMAQVFKDRTEYVTKKKWKKLKRVTVHEPFYVPYFDLYNQNTCKKVLENCEWIKSYPKYHLVKSPEGYYVLNLVGEVRFSDLIKVDTIGNEYLVLKTPAYSRLLNLTNWEVEIEGQYSTYRLTDSSVFAQHQSTDLVDIYVNQTKIVSGWTLVDDWSLNKNVHVFQDSTGVFFGTSAARKLTRGFEYIKLTDKAYLRAGDSACFTWINAQTILQLPFYFPVIVGDRQSGGAGNSRIGQFLGALFGQPTSGRSGSRYTETLRLDEGHSFYEGLAICATNKSKSEEPFEKPYHIGKASNLRYNYINDQGEFLNSKKYTDCFPFVNDKAWVSEGGSYYLIDLHGEQVGKLKFEKVVLDRNGCFIVSNNGNEGIVDANYNVVVKCGYFNIYTEDKRYYSKFGADKKLLYEAP